MRDFGRSVIVQLSMRKLDYYTSPIGIIRWFLLTKYNNTYALFLLFDTVRSGGADRSGVNLSVSLETAYLERGLNVYTE